MAARLKVDSFWLSPRPSAIPSLRCAGSERACRPTMIAQLRGGLGQDESELCRQAPKIVAAVPGPEMRIRGVGGFNQERFYGRPRPVWVVRFP